MTSGQGNHFGSPPETLTVAIVGFGTVGQAAARILCSRNDQRLQLTHICNRNVERKRVDWVPDNVMWTDDIQTVLASDVDIVVELIGGQDPAAGWIRRALEAGKSVVTANKQVIRALRRRFGGAREEPTPAFLLRSGRCGRCSRYPGRPGGLGR